MLKYAENNRELRRQRQGVYTRKKNTEIFHFFIKGNIKILRYVDSWESFNTAKSTDVRTRLKNYKNVENLTFADNKGKYV